MAIAANDLTLSGDRWAVNATSANASGTEEIKAAPTAGALYLEQIVITCAVNITVTIGAGETGGAVTTTLLGPITFATEVTAAGHTPMGIYSLEVDPPIKLANTTSLTIDASGAGAVQVFAKGFTR